MSKDLGILVIHGMGSQKPDFANDMIGELKGQLKQDASRVAWKPVYWQDILEARQEAYMRRARKPPNDLDYIKLRSFVVRALGDAVAYQKVTGANTTYQSVHNRIDHAVSDLYADLGQSNKPLVIMAHSLGAHIMSNYVWDMQRSGSSGMSAFEGMRTIAGMITFGCNIPLFTFAYKTVKPIRFPGAALSPSLKIKARWLNFYDSDDVLGYPLKAVDGYKTVPWKRKLRDIPINVGGILTNWNPLSHNGYWTDKDFTKKVVRFLKTLL